MTTPPKHSITTQYWNGTDNTIATCICGWWDRWPGSDGSAEQSGDVHLAREERKESTS